MGFILKNFQNNAIQELRYTFLDLWKNSNGRKIPITFKSPTGSGKTIMMAQFLKTVANDVQFNVDKAFIWFSFNEDSYKQSKEKLDKYYNGANELNLLDLTSIGNGKLENNDVFFINWQKLKIRTKEGRKLRTPGEELPSFDEYIENTHLDNREVILIVDEAHKDTHTNLAQDLIDLINPKIIIKITATPTNEPTISDVRNKNAGWVEVDREKVIEEGLIKEKVVVQTKEDLEAVTEEDQDRVLLELAFNKRNELKEFYKELGLNINPLVLIQLPNDETNTLGSNSKKEIAEEFLRDKGVSEAEVAVWLSDKKENLDQIEKDNSNISYLMFKQAAATGWDCPRAIILVMFREIRSPIFHTQTVGRILRMPEAKHYTISSLNVGYLYTNYERNQIKLPDNKNGENKPHIFSNEKVLVDEKIQLISTYFGRADYGDLGFTFQSTFAKVANSFFEIENNDLETQDIKMKLYNKGLEIENINLINKMIVDAEIESYDDFFNQINASGDIQEREVSKHDLEKVYNLLCFQIIAEQQEENKKYAPERSYGKLKSAINVWLKDLLNMETYSMYQVIVHDLLKLERSILKRIITESLEKYRPIREKELQLKAERSKQEVLWEIPETQTYTTDYEIHEFSKSIMQPFYLKKEYRGKENELSFLSYLDNSSSVKWWYKNGDSGRQYFAVPYFNTIEKAPKPFYVDFIVMLENGNIALFDTKNGATANTEGRAEGLYKYIQEKNSNETPLIGGIVIKSGGEWFYNDQKNYNYNPNDLKGWKRLNDLFVNR